MVRDQRHYFYVLHCRDDSLYGGYTNDLDQRLQAHNAGKGAKYTRVHARRPVKLIYAELYDNKSQAMSAEYRFKRLKRQQKLAYLQQHGVKLNQGDDFVLYQPIDQTDLEGEEADAEAEEL